MFIFGCNNFSNKVLIYNLFAYLIYLLTMTEDGGSGDVKSSNCVFNSPIRFDFKNTLESWDKWLKRFERYSFLTGLDDESGNKKVTTLIYCKEEEAEDMLAASDLNESDKNGYEKVKQFYSKFVKNFKASDQESFSKLTSDEERVSFVFSLPLVHSYKISIIRNSKSSESAKQFKEDGNRAFQANHFKVAMELYSKAIVKQPEANSRDKEELSVMYANRSAALYRLQEYEQALEDIRFSFEYNYPSHLQYKICDRKARCYLALNHLKSAKESFGQTMQALDVAKLSGDKRHKWQCDVQIMLKMLSKKKELRDDKKKKTVQETVQLKNGVNKQYPDISKIIMIKKTPKLGRFGEAKEDIMPGDVLLREKPHCSVLLKQYSETHCFQCFVRATVPYPCPSCSFVLFCSVLCRATALASHHRVECAVLPALWQSGASVTCLMALRVITQQPLEHFLQLRTTLKNPSRNKPYRSKDYITVYDLVTHSDKRSVEDLLNRSVMAVFLLRCLLISDYFQPQAEESITFEKGKLKENEQFIGGLILRHVQSLPVNSHEVSELVIEGKNKQSVFIGGAVYPSLALLNHSCFPGIVRYQNGTEVIARAIHTIRKGEMVSENYGPIFLQVPRSERQQTLRSQYWFECECEACFADWPILTNLRTDTMRFRCNCGGIVIVPVDTEDFMMQCQSCNQHVNILKGLKVLQDTDKKFRVAKTLVDKGQNETATNRFLELLTLLDSTLVPPFRDYHRCQQEIMACMLAFGNTYVKSK